AVSRGHSSSTPFGVPSEGPTREDKEERGPPRSSQARPGNGSTAEGHRPALNENFSRFPFSLHRRVRTRMLGGVGRAVSDDHPYPMYARQGRECGGGSPR